MASDAGSPKREPTPAPSISTIPQKRALDEGHSPAVSSPLNPEVKSSDPQTVDDAPNPSRAKSGRPKKDSYKKREAKGIESTRATPDPRSGREKEPEQTEASPLRYKLAPPKQSDFDPPRGPVLTPFHHDIENYNGEVTEFFETSDQYVCYPRPFPLVDSRLTVVTTVFSTRKTFATRIVSPTLSSRRPYTIARLSPNPSAPA